MGLRLGGDETDQFEEAVVEGRLNQLLGSTEDRQRELT